jgi:hypothetical protein
MSKTAPWFAVAADWIDSEMFDDSTMGERLAWICLLTHMKAVGRGGRAKLNKKAFVRRYDLTERAVSGMLDFAQNCGAIEITDSIVTICNWKGYQDPRTRKTEANVARFSKTSGLTTKDATKHPDTKHPPPTTTHPDTAVGGGGNIQTVEALKHHGTNPAKAESLAAEFPELEPLHVHLMAVDDFYAEANSPGGAMVSMVNREGWRRLTGSTIDPEIVWNLSDAGMVVSVCGKSPPFTGHNSIGLVISESEKIPAEMLTFESVVCRGRKE